MFLSLSLSFPAWGATPPAKSTPEWKPKTTERWIEAADWIVWQLCGHETRNVCTAGYKGMVQDGTSPSADYLAQLHPDFPEVLAKLDHPLSALGARAGSLTARAAAWTGLPEGIAVAVGNVDAHVTPPAAQAIDPGQLVLIMGTSTCHVMNGEIVAEGHVRGMSALQVADASREQVARTRMVSLSVLFEGTLPKGMMSRPTTLRT